MKFTCSPLKSTVTGNSFSGFRKSLPPNGQNRVHDGGVVCSLALRTSSTGRSSDSLLAGTSSRLAAIPSATSCDSALVRSGPETTKSSPGPSGTPSTNVPARDPRSRTRIKTSSVSVASANSACWRESAAPSSRSSHSGPRPMRSRSRPTTRISARCCGESPMSRRKLRSRTAICCSWASTNCKAGFGVCRSRSASPR